MDRYFLMLVLNNSQYNSIIDSSKTTGCHVQEGSNTPKTGEFTMFIRVTLWFIISIYRVSQFGLRFNANSKAV